MRDYPNSRWRGVGIVLLLIGLLLNLLRIRTILPDSWLVIVLILILYTAALLCLVLSFTRSHSKR
jgi:hypothetical protein